MHEVVVGALVREGRVLLVHRSPNRRAYPDVWDLPGGHVEKDESELDALAREMHEEVGVQIVTGSVSHLCRLNAGGGEESLLLSVPGLLVTGRECRRTSPRTNMTQSDGSGLKTCLVSPTDSWGPCW